MATDGTIHGTIIRGTEVMVIGIAGITISGLIRGTTGTGTHGIGIRGTMTDTGITAGTADIGIRAIIR